MNLLFMFFSGTCLTSSAVQCKIIQFLVLFCILVNLGWPRAGQILKFMQNNYEIRIQHAKNVGSSYLSFFSGTCLTSSAVQCKIIQFLVLFCILANLGWPGAGQISKFMQNNCEIRIQHAKNVGNSYLCVF